MEIRLRPWYSAFRFAVSTVSWMLTSLLAGAHCPEHPDSLSFQELWMIHGIIYLFVCLMSFYLKGCILYFIWKDFIILCSSYHVCVCAKSLQSCLILCTPRTVASQVPPYMGFSRQDYWSGLPCPPLGDLPHPGTESESLMSLHWQAGSLPLAPPESPIISSSGSFPLENF